MKRFFKTTLKLCLGLIILGYAYLIIYAYLPIEEIPSRTLATKEIGLRALSYNFETIKGRVYIAGITSNKDHLDAVIKTTKTIKGVKEIVNYVILNE